MNFTEFRFANTKRCRDSFHPVDDWSATDWACAVGGEAGEFQTLITRIMSGEQVDHVDIGREAADVVAYLDLLCVRLGIDLGAASISLLNESVQLKTDIGSSMSFTRFQQEYFSLSAGFTYGDYACAFGAATGELLNLIKKFHRGLREDRVYLPDVARAAALSLGKLSIVCSTLTIDMEKAIVLKFNEVSERIGSQIFLK